LNTIDARSVPQALGVTECSRRKGGVSASMTNQDMGNKLELEFGNVLQK